MQNESKTKLKYDELPKELAKQIADDRARGWVSPFRCADGQVVRRIPGADEASVVRPAFVRDAEKILHAPYYNRYADKTQVISFNRNDDITRRALHVQLVSRIARNIGRVLGLNVDLIEAIALGHDIGHTPFGHAGERFLSELLKAHTGKIFLHNVQSVRVLDCLFARNMSLQTLDGILCHNGEFACRKYSPTGDFSFSRFDADVAACEMSEEANKKLVPATLEGCVVRMSDMIAYLGKDRQDAVRAKIIPDGSVFTEGVAGAENAQIINNLSVNIIKNSYGRNEIRMDPEYFLDLERIKRENNEQIYQKSSVIQTYRERIQPMFEELYEKLLEDLKRGDENSLIFRHHVRFIEENRRHYKTAGRYADGEPNRIVADYLASMTDDYFVDLYETRHKVSFKGYFD